MEMRKIGASDLLVSAIGLGCNNFGGLIKGLDSRQAQSVIYAALDEGINFF